MNKRLKKKQKSHYVGITRRKLKEDNNRLVDRIAILTADKIALIQQNCKLQANLHDCKAAHVVDHSEQIKDITLLKATINNLSNMILELNRTINELHKENNELVVEMGKMKNMSFLQRVFSKGA